MALKCLNNFTRAEFSAFLQSFDTVLTDCDEVLWIGTEPIEGSSETMNRFKELGKRTYYVTNNSTCTRETLVEKLHRFGYHADNDDLVNSAFMAASYVKDLNLPEDAKVYIIGSASIATELDLVGIKHLGVGPDVLTTDLWSFLPSIRLDDAVRVVIVGFDPYFSVPKVMKACTYLNNPDTHFVATNPDRRSRYQYVVIPGAISMVRAVQTGSGREPVFVGKPDAYFRETIKSRWALVPERTLMIGDTCFTDIQLGTLSGFKTLLVLTGVSGLPEVSRWKEDGDESKASLIPDYYVNKLGDLYNWMA